MTSDPHTQGSAPEPPPGGTPHDRRAEPGQAGPGPADPGPGTPDPGGRPAQPAGGRSSGSGGGGCSKGLFGCGCLGVLGLIAILAVGGVLAWTQIPRAVGADSWAEMGQVVQAAERASRATGATRADAADPTTAQESRQAAQGFTEFFDVLEQTSVSRGDLERVNSTLADWDNSPDVRDFNEIFERVRGLGEDESGLQTLLNLRHLTRLAFRANDLGRTYRTEVEGPLGMEYRQVLTMARVSRVGSADDVDPWSQSVADALLQDHDQNRAEYLEARALLAQVMAGDIDPEELDEAERARLAEAYADHLTLVTAALNRQSLVAWAQLSDDERREIIERLDSPHNWVARISATLLHGDPEEDHLVFLRLMGF